MLGGASSPAWKRHQSLMVLMSLLANPMAHLLGSTVMSPPTPDSVSVAPQPSSGALWLRSSPAHGARHYDLAPCIRLSWPAPSVARIRSPITPPPIQTAARRMEVSRAPHSPLGRRPCTTLANSSSHQRPKHQEDVSSQQPSRRTQGVERLVFRYC